MCWECLAVSGCCEQERKKIDELTLNKQDLEGQLQQLKSELDDKQAELAKAQDQLAALRGEKGQWAQQLEQAKRQSAQNLPPGWEVRKGMVMTSLPVAVLFDPGKAVLKTSASSKLSTVLKQIQANFPAGMFMLSDIPIVIPSAGVSGRTTLSCLCIDRPR